MWEKWRWLALVAAAVPHGACAATDAAALLHLHDGATDLRVSGGAADAARPGVKGEADLSLALGSLTATISGRAQTSHGDSEESGRTATSGGTFSLNTSWQQQATRLDLKATQHFRSNVRDGSTAGALYVSRLEQQSGGQSESATARLNPVEQVTVELGVQSEASVTAQRQWVAGGAPATSRVETRGERETAKAAWQPLPGLGVVAKATVQTTNLAMHGSAEGRASYRAVEPDVTLTLKPWSGGALTLGVERQVTPLEAGTLAAYAAATGRPADAALKPDSAQSFEAGFEQHLGTQLSLSAHYANAQLDSTTVLVPSAGGQTPSSIAGGRRQRFDAALTLSLAALGLPRMTLSSKAMWQRSRIRDPLSGRMRRVSGEMPHAASVQVAQDLPRQHLRWGLEGKLGVRTDYYQAAEQTMVTQGDSFGAFVQYDPGPFSLRLDVDGLAGTITRDDTYYGSTRAGNIDRIVHSEHASPVIGLSLTKALDG